MLSEFFKNIYLKLNIQYKNTKIDPYIFKEEFLDFIIW